MKAAIRIVLSHETKTGTIEIETPEGRQSLEFKEMISGFKREPVRVPDKINPCSYTMEPGPIEEQTFEFKLI